jgi:hypothetical protein
MITIAASCEIEAPIARVYEVMMDFARYAEWNSFVRGVAGEARVGEVLTLDVVFYDGSKHPTRGRVAVITAPGETGQGDVAELTYCYAGPLAPFRLVRGTRRQVLTRLDAGRTRYEGTERFTGLLTAFLPRVAIQRGFDDVARELKRRVEDLEAARRPE